MAVRISGAAARWIVEATRMHVDRVGPDHIPVVVWIVQDSEAQSATPRLGMGLIERDLVDASRFLECDELECEIAQHIPDDVLAQYANPYIDILDEELVFAERS